MKNSNFPASTIKVGNDVAIIEQTFQLSESILVAAVDFNDGEGPCLIKKAINDNRNGKFLLRKEILMYNILKESQVRTLQLSTRSLTDCLVVKNVGITLKTWSHGLLHPLNNDLTDMVAAKREFMTCIAEVFKQIHFLHQKGFTHGDIRPANIIVLENNSPCLIDFVTCTKIGVCLEWIHGTVLYMADEVLTANYQAPFLFEPAYDLEAFAYSFLDCIDYHYTGSFLRKDLNSVEIEFGHDLRTSSFFEIRQELISGLQISRDPSFFPHSDLLDVFFNFLNQIRSLNHEKLTDQDYDELLNILTV